MQQVLNYSALQSGLAWLAASLTSIALAGLSQALVTRGGTRIVMAAGMTMIGAGAIWATQVPVHGHFLANLAGPMVFASAGTAFRVHTHLGRRARRREGAAGRAGVRHAEHQPAARRRDRDRARLERRRQPHPVKASRGHAAPAALTGGFQQTLRVLGGIGLLAVPAIFALVRRDELTDAVAKTLDGNPQPALAS